jgi:hypothetical protein
MLSISFPKPNATLPAAFTLFHLEMRSVGGRASASAEGSQGLPGQKLGFLSIGITDRKPDREAVAVIDGALVR